VKNALDVKALYDIVAPDSYKPGNSIEFQWNETVEIPQSTGRAMEESNGEKK